MLFSEQDGVLSSWLVFPIQVLRGHRTLSSRT